MKKIKLIVVLICFLIFYFSCKKENKINEPPNIIIVMTDDQGYGGFRISWKYNN